jgi:nitroreductase
VAAALAEHLGDAPVLIVACFLPSPSNPADFFGGASIYPAVQNLLVAARAVGLGATLTTLQAFDTATTASDGRHSADRAAELAARCARLKSLLGIPDPAMPAAVIPLGYPRHPFTTGTRNSLASVTYGEHWGRPWPHAHDRPHANSRTEQAG